MNILLVEDNDIDAFIINSYLKRANAECKVIRMFNGQEAIHYLEDNMQSEKLNLILLDLNLPIVNGKEVLRKINRLEQFKTTPVVVLSSSGDPMDILECEKYTKEYMEKPFDEQKTAKILQLAI